jgi:glycosyltransferase involved in cell wall biosynthesis
MIHSLSFVFPMYNERDNIEKTVIEAIRVGYLLAPEIEVIVVDDASTDGSEKIVDLLIQKHPELRVIRHGKNRKLGGALQSGFAAARKDWILYIDSDLPIRMDDAAKAIPFAEQADIVVGWRKSRAESAWREFMSKVYNRMVRLIFNLHVRDVNFAFKLFRRSFLDQIVLTSEGSFIDAELLLKMKRQGARFAEVGMNYYPRSAGVSKLSSPGVILTTLKEMMLYRLGDYGKRDENFGGERRRLWLKPRDQSRHTIGV